MFPYLIAFFISLCATYNAHKCKTNNFLFYIHICFAIIPLVLLAALRDEGVGTDTTSYIFLFESAVDSNDLQSYILLHDTFEVGFLLYNYLLSRFVTDVVSYYMITYSIIVGLIFASAFKLRRYISPPIFIIIYCFLFYSESLNIMRQYIAISFIMYGLSHLLTRNKTLYILCTAIACLFHIASLISILIAGTYWLTKKYPLYNHRFLYLLLSIAVFVASLWLIFLANIGVVPIFEDKLEGYLSNSFQGAVSSSHIIVYSCTFLFICVNYKKATTQDFFILLSLFIVLLLISPSMNATLYRLTLYFNVVMCIAVSYSYKNSVKGLKQCSMYMLLSIYIVFYYFSFVMNGTGEVIPYTSFLLGII